MLVKSFPCNFTDISGFKNIKTHAKSKVYIDNIQKKMKFEMKFYFF